MNIDNDAFVVDVSSKLLFSMSKNVPQKYKKGIHVK